MSRLFGPIRQMGYIVSDIQAELKRWTVEAGVGPFYRLPRVTFERYVYKGIESSPELEVALAYSGDMQVELIQPVNDAHSSYKEFLAHGGSGMQHVGVFSENFTEDAANCAAAGLRIVQEGVIAGSRFAFYGSELFGGTMMEVFESFPHYQAMFDFIRTASVGWDGADPIRHL